MAHLSVQLLNEKVIDADNLIKVRYREESLVNFLFFTLGNLCIWSISHAHFIGITSEIFF